MGVEFRIVTDRLVLRPWRSSDGAEFASMNADPEVMADLGGPLDRAASDAKLERFRRTYEEQAITRWVVAEAADDAFLGYCGVVPHGDEHALGAHHEIGWRLIRAAWGRGYASEAARAALTDAFDRVGCERVLAYTAPDNHRSRGVMERLGLDRSRDLDFVGDYDGVAWSGQVWVASPSTVRTWS